MLLRTRNPTIHKAAVSVVRVFRYAFNDWTREMDSTRRFVTMAGVVLQGYAFYALWTRSLVWPVMWPSGPVLYVSIWLLYMLGYWITNVLLTSEFVRKTQLESDLIAAQQIQRTLQPDEIEQLSCYRLESYYRPFRSVGGDYFDVIDLGGNRTLFALADVSGKGMPAALVSSNIQALVRSIADTKLDVATLAHRLNQHLVRYTPRNRFATAIFILLAQDSGELMYVNAGHNRPIIYGSGSTTFLEPTGLPLGLFAPGEYDARAAKMHPGDLLLVYTDGLTDSISGDGPESRLREALTGEPKSSLANLERLIDPALNEDDVTILLVQRTVPEVRDGIMLSGSGG
ncbi:MAG: serine/threonine-protein phosphatase [Acidobacteriaceae bacterium]|nr:serine/threonine-protein phosphatase [Acidobacteriaceae bacterium]